jgi:iron transport multicopper oxidase
MQVNHGTTYRFRLISSSGFYPFEFSIDNHTFDVIAADGDYLQRSGPFNYLQIQAGERYDILIKADKLTGRFWMRAYTLEASFPDHQILGVLSYDGSNALPTASAYLGNSTGTRRANCFHDYGADCISAAGFKPLIPQTIGEPDITTSIHLRFLRGPLMNATRWAEPETPPLFAGGDFSRLPGVFPCNASLTLADRTARLGENCTSVLHLDLGAKVRVVMDNLWYAAHIAGLHSIHLHGHSFAVLRMAYGEYTGQELNVIDPPMRDTVIVPPGGHTVIQFTADNPGAWMLHCHQDLHLNDGMATIISTAPDMLRNLRPPKDFAICSHWDAVAYEGNPSSEPLVAPEPEHWPY